MATVLLFGGRSFLGGHICRVLVKRGYRVILQSTSSAEFQNLADLIPHPAIEPVVCGLDDPDAIRGLLDRSKFMIYAAIPYSMQSLGRAPQIQRELRDFDATLAVLRSSNVEKSVFVSVSGTVGRVPRGTADETLTAAADTPRSWGHLKEKLAAEDIIARHVRDGLRAVIVNPSMCIGEFDTRPSTGEFFRFIALCPFAVMPAALLNIVDVEDVALGTVLALEKGRTGRRYILSGTNTTMGALIRRIRQLAGKSMPRLTLRRSMAIPIAYCCEVANLVLRRPKPVIPLLGIELIEQGSQHLTSEKAAVDLGFTARDAWAAVDRAYRWYVDHGLL
jgi:dihydroflavonol-4-reductase